MPETVIALYRPHEGRSAELDDLVRRHWPLLREEELVTARRPLVLRGADGTILDIFEWRPGGAADAHENPRVQALWSRMMEVAEMVTLSDLAEASRPFPHFKAADDLAGRAPTER